MVLTARSESSQGFGFTLFSPLLVLLHHFSYVLCRKVLAVTCEMNQQMTELLGRVAGWFSGQWDYSDK